MTANKGIGAIMKRLSVIIMISALMFSLSACGKEQEAVVIQESVFSGQKTQTYGLQYRVPEADETFRICGGEGPNGYVEWKDAKLTVTFPDTAESRIIEFHPEWLPFEMPSSMRGSIPEQNINSDTWFSRLSAEMLPLKGGYGYEEMNQPLLIDTYSMSMFNNGGALLLLYYTPNKIMEEHWDELNVEVMRFHCSQHFDAVPDLNIWEHTLEQDIILMSNSEAGWVIRVCGEIGMDSLIKVAKNLEIRETGQTMNYKDFDNHYTFMDGGVG